MNTAQTAISLTPGQHLIVRIVRDLDARAVKATGAERDRLEAAAAHYRSGDVIKRLRKQGFEI
jgi:hypothetical protein